LSHPDPVEHWFRHEYGRLVAVLARRAGLDRLEAVEDAVQVALMRALETWSRTGEPDNPSAWLFRVAHNQLMGDLRQQASRRALLQQDFDAFPPDIETNDDTRLPGEVQDDLLRMMFVCCDPDIPLPSRLVLALKTLCGFSVPEIAIRLFATEANVYKRLGRARSRLQHESGGLGELGGEQVASRLPAVHTVLYLLFTEGYMSAHQHEAIRQELCDEALRLTTLLAEHPAGQSPETDALLALMHLQLARMGGRLDAGGGLLLLEDQDRSLWDTERIHTGLAWLANSARGEHFSRYHAEAGIAAEHCMAPSFEESRWDRVVECYELLEHLAPSPLHRLNRAVAVAEWKGPDAGLAILAGFEAPAWLTDSYLWQAVKADLHLRCGHFDAADTHQKAALKAAPTEAIKSLLRRRFRRVGSAHHGSTMVR